jgi:hypothetical protein
MSEIWLRFRNRRSTTSQQNSNVPGTNTFINPLHSSNQNNNGETPAAVSMNQLPQNIIPRSS